MSEVINVIKYEGDKSTFIWKHSCTNYKIDSQLIVPVSQKAIFFADGQALDIFGPGTHILQTQNIPLISNYFSLTAEHKKTNFQCELYFINKSQEMVMKCDTGCRAEYFEPMFQFPLTIGVKGQMSISVNNSVKLITKLRDTDTGLERIRLLEYFRSFLISKLITVLSQTLKNDKINIFEIDKELDVFSEKLKIKLMDIFSDNGLLLNQFFITEFVIPEDHINYKEYKKQYFEKCSDIQLDDLDKELEIKPDKASQDQQLEKYNEYEQMLREKQVLEAKINLLKQAIKLRKYDKYEEKLKKKKLEEEQHNLLKQEDKIRKHKEILKKKKILEAKINLIKQEKKRRKHKNNEENLIKKQMLADKIDLLIQEKKRIKYDDYEKILKKKKLEEEKNNLLKQEKKRKKYDKLLWAKKASESSDETLTLPDLEKQKKLLIKKTFRLDEQIKYAVLMQENQWKPKNIEIKLYLPEVHYFGNEELLFHAWINLINNAIKFTPENGKIFIFHSCTANELTITTRDTGIGIEKNIIDHIFNKKLQEDKNSSAEDESELVRVKGIINLCSGKMSVKSIPDKGSTFIVTLERSK